MSTFAQGANSGFELRSEELEHLHSVREDQRRNLRRALLWSAMSHLSVITILLLIALVQRNAPKAERAIVVPYRELQAPPSLQQTPPTVQVAAPAAAPTAGIPLPTEDEEGQEEQTIATQDELSQTIGTGETGTGDSLVIAPPSDELPAYGDYVYVEELPEAIKKVQPEYPDLARQANMEGTVIVQALVGKDGRVKDTKVVKSVSVLDDAAVAAVKNWVFKPALSNNKPVAVWVAVPVKFTLH
jgi:protein TonB